MRRFLALTLVLAAATVAVPTFSASAGPFPEIDVDLVGPFEPLTFRAAFTDDYSCNPFTITAVGANDTEVTPLAVVDDPEGDPNVKYIVLASDTPPGELLVVGTCTDDIDFEGEGVDSWAALAITKVVEGPVPSDATFVVEADCIRVATMEEDGGFDRATGIAGVPSELELSLEYGPTGGRKYLYFPDRYECTITEPVNGGAIATTIVPAEVFVEDPAAYASTVTNTFAAVVEPTFTG